MVVEEPLKQFSPERLYEHSVRTVHSDRLGEIRYRPLSIGMHLALQEKYPNFGKDASSNDKMLSVETQGYIYYSTFLMLKDEYPSLGTFEMFVNSTSRNDMMELVKVITEDADFRVSVSEEPSS